MVRGAVEISIRARAPDYQRLPSLVFLSRGAEKLCYETHQNDPADKGKKRN